jgi:hypothetical protein
MRLSDHDKCKKWSARSTEVLAVLVRYEIVRAKSDFYDRRETDVLRLVAKKP